MDKLYQIVNAQDEVIGHKLHHEIDYKRDIYRIAALWLTNTNDEVLMAQRLLTKDNDPGKWGPAAAGTMEQGETYETNIYKEAEEEIGLTGIEFTAGPKMRFGEPRQAFCQWFLGKCDWPQSRFRPQPEEVEGVKWVKLEELQAELEQNPDNYVPSLPQIIEVLYPDR